MTTFIEEGETLEETNHKQIFENYINKGGMKLDLFTWIPIVFFVDCTKEKFFRLFYLLKALRIIKAIKKFDIVGVLGLFKTIKQ